MKLDLTKIGLVTIIIVVFIFGLRQCETKNVYKKQSKTLLSENTELKVYASSLEGKSASQKRQINNLHLRITELDEAKREIKAEAEAAKKELENISADTLYILYRQNHVLIGKMFLTDSTLMAEDLKTRIELKECKEISSTCKTENDFLNEIVNTYSTINLGLEKRLTETNMAKIKLEEESVKQEIKLEKTKKKVWTNRFIAGGGVIFGLLVLL